MVGYGVQRQPEPRRRAFARRARQGNVTAVRLGNVTANGQAQAGTMVFSRRKERLKYVNHILVGDAGSRV